MRIGSALLFGGLPLLLSLVFLGANWGKSTFLYDFRGDVYQAARDIAHGRNPYNAVFLDRQADQKRAGRSVETVFATPVYPAPALVVAVPLSFLPYRAAAVLFVLLSLSALILALRLVGVADWRCYGTAFLCWPVLHGLMLGAVTPLLVLGVAAVWRWRDDLWRPALGLAAIVMAKLFLWPIGVWFVLTRRYRTVGIACAIGVVLAAGWAAVDLRSFLDYPGMLQDLSFLEAGVGVSAVAGLLAAGLGQGFATVTAFVLAAILLGAAWLATRGERRTFAAAVLAALVASPIVWPHYLALLFIPIALLSPRLSAIWFAPLLAYLAPVAQTSALWEMLPYYAIVGLVAYRVFRGPRSGARREYRSGLRRALLRRPLARTSDAVS